MKSFKPLLLVSAGVLITVALFSFKNEGPVKEYAEIFVDIQKSKVNLVYGTGEIKEHDFDPKEKFSSVKRKLELCNSLAKEGWKVIGTDAIIIYLERTK